MRRYGLYRGLLLLLVVSVLVGRAPGVAAAVLYRDDFAGSSPGWSYTLGSGAANTVNFNAGGTLLVQAECCGPEFPLVGRNDLFTGTNAYWRFSLRFRYSEVTAYGTSLAIGSAAFDAGSRQAHTAPGRSTWEDVLSIMQVQGMAADNFFRIRAFGNLHYDYNTLPAPDLNWHTLVLTVNAGMYGLLLDGVPIGAGAATVAPRSFWMGNYYTQPHWGNWSDIQVDWVQVETDLEPPTSSLSVSGTPGNAGWYRSTLAVTQSATDAWSGVQQQFYRFNGGAWQTGATYSLTSQGTNTVNYYATDWAGNTEAAQTATYRIDSVPPTSNATLNCSNPGNAGWCRGSATVTLTGSDATSGLEVLIYRLNAGLPQVYAAPFSVATEGTTLVRYLGVDVAGNSETERETPVRVDTVPPVTSLTLNGTPGNAGWYRSAVQVTLSAVDAASGVATTQYRVNGGAWQTGSSVNLTAEGTHTLEYRSTDVAGNTEALRTQTIRIDSVAPTVTGSSACSLAGSAGWCRGTATVTLTGSDATSGLAALTYEVNGGATQTYSAPWNVTSEGVHQVVYRGVDVAGNPAADQTLAVQIDTVPPVTTLALNGTPGNAGWYRSAVQVTLTAMDTTSGVATTQYRVNGGDWQTGSSANLTAEGTHTLEYYTTDRAGNPSVTETLTLRLDTLPPTVQAALSGAQGRNGWYTATVSITLTGQDATSGLAGLELAGTPYTAPRSYTTDGAYTLGYTGVDIAGNTSVSETVRFWRDATPPQASVSAGAFCPQCGEYLTLPLTAHDATAGLAAWTVELTDATGAGVRLWSGSGAPPATLAWDGRAADGTLLPAGTYAVTLTARDRAGWQTRRAAAAVITPPATPTPVPPVPLTPPPSTSPPMTATPLPTTAPPTAQPPRTSTPQPTPTPTPTATGLPSVTPTALPPVTPSATPTAQPTPAPVPPPLLTCAVQLSVFQDTPGAAQYRPDTPGTTRLSGWSALVDGQYVTTTAIGLVTLLLAPGEYPVTFVVPAAWAAVSAPQLTMVIDAACGVQVQTAAGARIAYDPEAPVSLAVQPRPAARAGGWGWLWAWPLTLSVWLVATAATDRRGRALAQVSAQFAVMD